MTVGIDKRIKVIVGHYGSGKTEFSVNYALQAAAKGKRVALVDLDIANPYFRSRERQQLLEDNGVKLFSNTFGYDITADLPAISARIRAPLEDPDCDTIVDAGGDNLGARILIQFEKYWKVDCDVLCVVNASRPETSTLEGAMDHIARIRQETGLDITGLINNTHMLNQTQSKDVIKGYRLCKELSSKLGIPIKYNCCMKEVMEDLKLKTNEFEDFNLFEMKLYMRQ